MTDARPVKVGLVGAGPWASMFHAPILAGGPETVLTGIWARGLKVITPTDRVDVAFTPAAMADIPAVLRRDLLDVVRNGADHPCDVRRGLELQAVIAAAEEAIASGGTVKVPDEG